MASGLTATALITIAALFGVACSDVLGIEPATRGAPPASAPSGISTDVLPGPEPVRFCSDVLTDPHNCGACFHDCLGGACTQGICQAAPLVTEQVDVSKVAANLSHLAWATPAGIVMCDLPRCETKRVIANADPTGGLALGSTQAFFTTMPKADSTVLQIQSCWLGQCPKGQALVGTGRIEAFGNTLISEVAGSGISACELPWCSDTRTAAAFGPLDDGTSRTVGVDAAFVYVVRPMKDGTGGDGVYRFALDGTTVDKPEFVLRLPTGHGPAVHALDGTLVWQDGRGVRKCQTANCTRTQTDIFGAEPDADTLMIAGPDLFEWDASASTLRRGPLTGGTVQQLHKGSVRFLAVTKSAAYWLAGSNTIMRQVL